MRSGQTLVLIPIPGTNSKGSIFDRKGSYGRGRGHFPDPSVVIKHRLSDVSTHQISIANARGAASTTPRMQDIEEENLNHLAAPPLQSLTSDASYNVKGVLQSTINAHTTKSIKPLNDTPHNKGYGHESPVKSGKVSRREQQQSRDMEYLRDWTTSFLFKPSKESKVLDPADLLKRNGVDICEGCQTKIKLKNMENNTLPTYEAGEGSNKQTFVFCNKYCERLRKYKEAIRQYAFEYEFAQTYGVMPCEMDKPDRFIHLFAMKDGLLVVDSELSQNANTDDKKPCKPRPKKDKDKELPHMKGSHSARGHSNKVRYIILYMPHNIQ